MSKRKIFKTILILSIITSGAINVQGANVPMNISLNVNPGQTFDVKVTVDPLGIAIAGMQLNIDFNNSIISINNITEGDLFKQNGSYTSFSSGAIDKSAGRVINVYDLILGKANVSTPGTFIIINATSIGASNIAWINLSNVKLVDPDGNYIALNTPVQSTRQQYGSGSTSSSGEGGGGGTSGESFTNIEIKEKYDRFIIKNITTSYIFKETDPISSVNITGNISAGEIIVAVEILRNTSSLVNSPAPDIVYKNANIWVGTYGFAASQNIKHAEIMFRVPVSWIESNSVDPDSITMMHYQVVWAALPTKKIRNTSEWIYYEASTTRFSPHAITGKKSTGSSYSGMSQDTSSQQLEKSVNSDGNHTNTSESSGDLGKYLMIGAFIGMAIIAILIYKLRRPKEEDIFNK